MAKKITVNLRKGGSGKTTTAINIAAAMHQMGKRVLLVDLDPQANATLAVGIDPLTLEKNINHLFTDIYTVPRDVIIKTSFGMDILPSHPDLAATEAGMKATQIGVLKGLLEAVEADYDYIVIDTPPSESYLTINALAYADEVVIPLQAHFLALQGLAQAMDNIEQVTNGLNPGLRVRGILPTMVNQRTNIAKSVIDQVREQYPRLLYPVTVDYSVKHTEATLAGLPIVIYDPIHGGSEAYRKVAESLI